MSYNTATMMNDNRYKKITVNIIGDIHELAEIRQNDANRYVKPEKQRDIEEFITDAARYTINHVWSSAHQNKVKPVLQIADEFSDYLEHSKKIKVKKIDPFYPMHCVIKKLSLNYDKAKKAYDDNKQDMQIQDRKIMPGCVWEEARRNWSQSIGKSILPAFNALKEFGYKR